MRYLPIIVFSIWYLAVSIFASSSVTAATLTETGSPTTVSATVPAQTDTSQPDIPNLVSPANQSVIGTNAPTFIFEPSLGIVNVTHYQLWLDGTKNTDHIPPSTITITTNALNSLSEGQHSWFIKAIGSNGNTRDSAIWTFTVDTTAPLIIIESVADQPTSLSSANLAIFTGGVEFTTTDLTPTFIGQGETEASLTISLTGSGLSINLDTIVDSQGNFSLTPETSLIIGSYTVSVSSTDASGNTTTLPSFTLIIIAPTADLIIPLPSPFTDLEITFPRLPFSIATLIPELPAALVAFPIALEALLVSYLPWIIIFLLLIHLALLIRRLKVANYPKSSQPNNHNIYLYITLWLPFLVLIWLILLTWHWIPLVLMFFNLGLAVYEHKNLV
jgi:hypothetical protein